MQILTWAGDSAFPHPSVMPPVAMVTAIYIYIFFQLITGTSTATVFASGCFRSSEHRLEHYPPTALLHNNKSSTLPLPHMAAAPSPTPPSHSALALHIPHCYRCSLSPQPQGRHRGLPNSPPVPSARDNKLAAPIGCKPPHPLPPHLFAYLRPKAVTEASRCRCTVSCSHFPAAFSAVMAGPHSQQPIQGLPQKGLPRH